MQEAQRQAAHGRPRGARRTSLGAALAAMPSGRRRRSPRRARPRARVRHACATGERSTRWSAVSRTGRSPTPLLPCLVGVALYQIEHTRAPPFAVVDHAVDAAATLARPAAKATRQRAPAPLPARARRARRGSARGSRRAVVASGLVDRSRSARPSGRLGSDPRGRQRAAAAHAPRERQGPRARCARRAVRGRGDPRHPGGRRRGPRRAAAAGVGAAGLRRRRILGAGPGRAARRAAPPSRARNAGARRLRRAGRQDDASRGARRCRDRRARRRRRAAHPRARESRAAPARRRSRDGRRRRCRQSPPRGGTAVPSI